MKENAQKAALVEAESLLSMLEFVIDGVAENESGARQIGSNPADPNVSYSGATYSSAALLGSSAAHAGLTHSTSANASRVKGVPWRGLQVTIAQIRQRLADVSAGLNSTTHNPAALNSAALNSAALSSVPPNSTGANSPLSHLDALQHSAEALAVENAPPHSAPIHSAPPHSPRPDSPPTDSPLSDAELLEARRLAPQTTRIVREATPAVAQEAVPVARTAPQQTQPSSNANQDLSRGQTHNEFLQSQPNQFGIRTDDARTIRITPATERPLASGVLESGVEDVRTEQHRPAPIAPRAAHPAPRPISSPAPRPANGSLASRIQMAPLPGDVSPRVRSGKTRELNPSTDETQSTQPE